MLSFVNACTVNTKVSEIRSQMDYVRKCITSFKCCKKEEIKNEKSILIRACNNLITMKGRTNDLDKERKISLLVEAQEIMNKKD